MHGVTVLRCVGHYGLLVLLLGCGAGQPTVPNSKDSVNALSPAVPATTVTTGVTNSDSAITEVAQTAPSHPDPQVILERLLAAVPAGRFSEVWSLLPPSYRKDLERVVRQYGTQADPELWRATGQVLRQAGRTLRAQQARLLATPSLSAPATRTAGEEVKQAWGSLCDVLEEVGDSALFDQARLAQLDVEALLGSTGERVGASWRQWSELSGLPTGLPGGPVIAGGLSLKTLSVEPDRARVEMRIGKTAPHVVEFSLVEGYWVPAGVVRDWPAFLAQFAVLNDQATTQSATAQRAWLSWMQQFQQALAMAEVATTDEQFHPAWFNVLVLWSELPKLLSPAPPLSRVELQISGITNDTLEEELLAALKQAADPTGAVDYTCVRSDTTCRITLTQVPDVPGFLERLTFLDAVEVAADVGRSGPKITGRWATAVR